MCQNLTNNHQRQRLVLSGNGAYPKILPFLTAIFMEKLLMDHFFNIFQTKQPLVIDDRASLDDPCCQTSQVSHSAQRALGHIESMD
jgi:hypothetical protein